MMEYDYVSQAYRDHRTYRRILPGIRCLEA